MPRMTLVFCMLSLLVCLPLSLPDFSGIMIWRINGSFFNILFVLVCLLHIVEFFVLISCFHVYIFPSKLYFCWLRTWHIPFNGTQNLLTEHLRFPTYRTCRRNTPDCQLCSQPYETVGRHLFSCRVLDVIRNLFLPARPNKLIVWLEYISKPLFGIGPKGSYRCSWTDSGTHSSRRQQL